MIIRIILHINDREEGSLIISKSILIVLITLKWFCQAVGGAEPGEMFVRDQQNNILVPGPGPGPLTVQWSHAIQA